MSPSKVPPVLRSQAETGTLNRTPQAAGQARIASSYRIEQGNVYISNNVSYIVLLNEGSSAQAPAAFVQMAIGRALTTVTGR